MDDTPMPPAIAYDDPADDDYLSSHHEAGHAVVATVLGAKVIHVTIDYNEESRPHCDSAVGDRMPAYRRSVPEAAVIIAMAGRYGVQLYDPNLADNGAEIDDAKVAEIYSSLGDHIHTPLDQLQRQACWYVRRYAPQIRKLARALREHRSLTGAEVRKVIGPLVRPSPFGPSYARM